MASSGWLIGERDRPKSTRPISTVGSLPNLGFRLSVTPLQLRTAVPARPFDAVGAFLVSLGNIQELAAHLGVAHPLNLLPDDQLPLPVPFRARPTPIRIIYHTTLTGA